MFGHLAFSATVGVSEADGAAVPDVRLPAQRGHAGRAPAAGAAALPRRHARRRPRRPGPLHRRLRGTKGVSDVRFLPARSWNRCSPVILQITRQLCPLSLDLPIFI